MSRSFQSTKPHLPELTKMAEVHPRSDAKRAYFDVNSHPELSICLLLLNNALLDLHSVQVY